MLLIFDLDDTLFARLPDNYTDEDIKKMVLFPYAREILGLREVKKVLVSKGDAFFQFQKIRRLGIEELFDTILITQTDEGKKGCFQQALAQFPTYAVETWVIGDRVDSEIKYGNELGLKTVLFRHAEGKYNKLVPKVGLEKPLHIVSSFLELRRVLGIEEGEEVKGL